MAREFSWLIVRGNEARIGFELGVMTESGARCEDKVKNRQSTVISKQWHGKRYILN